jgi:DNA repair protein RecO (recombination protein O)
MANHERTLRTEAVIIKHVDWGEGDRILTLYTREQGKIRALAKGVRKINSRKAGHLEPFSRTELMLAAGRDFWIVTQAESKNTYPILKNDLIRMGYAAYVVELVDKFSVDGQETRTLYKLLTETLDRMEKLEDLVVVIRYYEIQLLDHLGYRPQLITCVHCGKEILAQDQYFSAEQGGVLCPNCPGQAKSVRPISLDALRFMRHFQRSTFQDAAKAHMSSQTSSELEELMHYLITYLLERGLNSTQFIRSVQ